MDPNQASQVATDSTWTLIAPYLKAALGMAIAWAIGKAQKQGGPLGWFFKGGT